MSILSKTNLGLAEDRECWFGGGWERRFRIKGTAGQKRPRFPPSCAAITGGAENGY